MATEEDRPLKTELSYREFSRQRYGSDYIPIMKALYDEIGKERLLELVRNASYAKNMAHGRSMAQRAPDTRFYTLMQAFRNPNPNALMTNTTVWEVIEDSAPEAKQSRWPRAACAGSLASQ